MDPEKSELEPTQNRSADELSAALRAELVVQQDPVYAIVGGLSAAIVGAVLWAVITVSTKYQIGYMAIGVGLLTGFAVRYFGAGVDRYFGFIGAVFALMGCMLGNLLSQVGFIADAQSIGYFETITLLDFNLVLSIYTESFAPMDVFFYGIAAYEGYRFAFRNVTDELTQAVSEGRLEPPPFTKLRLPVVIVLFVALSIGGYLINKGSTGLKTYNYPSGAKRTTGELVHGKENGAWEAWWENGKLQSQGYYVDGNPDSVWKYYNEEGVLFRTGTFKGGVQDGEWTDYYPGGSVSGTGKYNLGRQHGLWSYSYEDGSPESRGEFLLDLQEGPWETFYKNGKTSSKGSYSKGIQTGMWTYWNEDGRKSSEIDFGNRGKPKILNTWTAGGTVEIRNGNGIINSVFPGGQLLETGTVKEGYRVGQWRKNYKDGSKQEEGDYRSGTYYITNSWSTDGKPMVTNGEGAFESYHADGSLFETGLVRKGLRTGKWTMYFIASDSIMSESIFAEGKLNGTYQAFFENGQVNIKGTFSDDKRVGEWIWFTHDADIESSITFKEGKKEGIQLFFDASGKVLRKELYKNGELVASKLGSEILN